jgi:hypothetical protein
MLYFRSTIKRYRLSCEQRNTTTFPFSSSNLNAEASLSIKPTILLSTQYTRAHVWSFRFRLFHSPRCQLFAYAFALEIRMYAADVKIPALGPVACPVHFRGSDSSVKEACTGGVGSAVGKEVKRNFVVVVQYGRDQVSFDWLVAGR